MGTMRMVPMRSCPTRTVSECFSDIVLWAQRSSNFEDWFPIKKQPATPEGLLTVVEAEKDWMFRESAESLPGVSKDLNRVALGNQLIKLGYTITNTQAEKAVMMTEAGETTHLRIDGYGNFFFTQTGDKNNPVAVGCVGWVLGDEGYYASVRSLDDGNGWAVKARLIIRNLDPSKL